jgi:Rha family phage regulatory protein
MNKLVSINEQNQNVTTSIIVAETFIKRHSDVLRDIRELSCSEDFNKRNFALKLKTTDLGLGRERQDEYYEITKDGFSFLVMGYTGEKAAKFKEMFIEAFNTNEALLASDDYILLRSQEILKERVNLLTQQNQILEHTNQILEEEKKILLPKAEYTDTVLQSISTYTFTQIAKQLNIASAQALCKRLVALEVLYYQSGGYLPHSKYSTQGYWGTRTHAITDENGNIVRTTNYLVVTELGRAFLRKKLQKQIA